MWRSRNVHNVCHVQYGDKLAEQGMHHGACNSHSKDAVYVVVGVIRLGWNASI